jgi:hypothetical protein
MKSNWAEIQQRDIGGQRYVRVKDLVDISANRVMLCLRQLAVPEQSQTHNDLLRGAIAELQQIEALHEPVSEISAV